MVAPSAPLDRSVLGRRSRNKGTTFERVIRDHIRSGLPSLTTLTVRRSSQSERAWEADLIIEGPGVPEWLTELWVECQHANDPDPPSKYAQAVRDATLYQRRTGKARVPVVIWRKTRSRDVWVTTTLGWFDHLLGRSHQPAGAGLLSTVLLSELLGALRSRLP